MKKNQKNIFTVAPINIHYSRTIPYQVKYITYHLYRWSKEYHTVIYIRTVLEQIPAKPPVLTPKQQLDRLRSTKDSTREILTSPTSSFSR